MTTFVAGATGATGRLLVAELVARGLPVRAIVRDPARLPGALREHERVTLRRGSLLDFTDAELAECVRGCDAVVSCLGHNVSFQGLFGHPRRLVTDATRRLCQAIRAARATQGTHVTHATQATGTLPATHGAAGHGPGDLAQGPAGPSQESATPARFILMNTTANRHSGQPERVSLGEKMVLGLLGVILPPHADNLDAAAFLRTGIGPADDRLDGIEWVAVRPDGLIDQDAVTEYEIHPAPIRSPIFNPGKVSRINVAHFMAELITDDQLWQRWSGRMPVLYNRPAS